MEIYHKDKFIGRIREAPICVWCSRKHLIIFDKNNEKIYDVSGPCCPISCGGPVNFQVRKSFDNFN